MANRKSLASLAEKLSPEARERAALKANGMSEAMDLTMLPCALRVSHRHADRSTGRRSRRLTRPEITTPGYECLETTGASGSE